MQLDEAELAPIGRGGADVAAFRQLVSRKAHEVYARREVEYPATVGLAHSP